jgi:7-keto-8-aminopelargonate synthetase-like enzyme
VVVCESKRYECVRGVREYVRGCWERIFGKDCGRFGGFVFCKNKIKNRLRNNLIVIKKRRFRQLRL